MRPLPPGWHVSNSEGSFHGPPLFEDGGGADDIEDDNSGSEMDQDLDIRPDSPGWEDVEPSEDVEALHVNCLICDEIFNDAGVMLDHCRSEHSFDFLEIRRLHNLDFYSTIKLINYIRTEVKDGRPPDIPDLADASLWADERYLQPVMDEDALLFSLDDLVNFAGATGTESAPVAVDTNEVASGHA